jgi:hypothetical protein
MVLAFDLLVLWLVIFIKFRPLPIGYFARRNFRRSFGMNS